MRYFYFTFFLLTYFQARAQLDTDSLFNSSLNHARAGDYILAVNEAQKVLSMLPERADVMVHLANLFAWQSKFDSAKYYIGSAYSLEPRGSDIYDSWLNVLLWSGDYPEIHRVAELASENKYENEANIALKKLLAFQGTGNYREGVSYGQSLSEELLNDPGIKAVYQEIFQSARQNQVTAYYSIDVFGKNNPLPHHLAFIDYAFKIGKNTLIPRLNFTRRFEMNDFQAEADYYYVTGDNGYFYFNYGISIGNKLFPGHRIGAEYFFSGADLMDVSLGGRFLSYSNFKVWIVTGQAGKYFHNVWLALRPFAVFYEGGTGFALTGNCRLYAVNPANYWGIEAGYGHSPDDRYTISSTGELFKLIAYRVKAEKNISLSFSDELKVSAGYSNEEFIENTFRNRFIIEVLFRHRF